MKLSTYAIAAPAIAAAVVIALANRREVVFSLDPFSQSAPALALALPLWLLLFAALIGGVAIGGFAASLTRLKRAMKAKEPSARRDLLPIGARETKTPPQ